MELFFNPLDHSYHHGAEDGPIMSGVTSVIAVPAQFFTPDDALRGTHRHKMIELYNDNDLDEDTLAEEYRLYLEAWKRFLSETGFEVKKGELKVHHDTYLYAGTLDLIGRFPTDTVDSIGDIKTGVYATWSELQTAAYAGCLEGFYKRFVIQLKSDGKYKLYHHNYRGNYNDFLTLLNSKRVREKYNI